MKDLGGKVAAISGAASGIGRALAVALADEGCHVAISDVDGAGLEETAGMIDNPDVRVTIHQVDVSVCAQVKGYADEVARLHGAVHLVINNAGVVVMESIEDLSYKDFEWLMGINLWGVVYGCKEFLPHLRKQPEGHIVNISSVNGIFTNPNNGAYCTAKFAVRGFTETLCQELAGSGIMVSCVHPGGVKTNIVRNARYHKACDLSVGRDDVVAIFDRLAGTTAEKAARIIIEGIKKNECRIMVGPDSYVYDWLKRLFPVGLQKLTGRKKIPGWIKRIAKAG